MDKNVYLIMEALYHLVDREMRRHEYGSYERDESYRYVEKLLSRLSEESPEE